MTAPELNNRKEFRFIELFCGIGGFHHAMTGLGGRCMFACPDAYRRRLFTA